MSYRYPYPCHPPEQAPDGTWHRVPDWRPRFGLIVGWLPLDHGPNFMSKLYRLDDTALAPRVVRASRWLLWRDADQGWEAGVQWTGVFRCLRRARWRRGMRPNPASRRAPRSKGPLEVDGST